MQSTPLWGATGRGKRQRGGLWAWRLYILFHCLSALLPFVLDAADRAAVPRSPIVPSPFSLSDKAYDGGAACPPFGKSWLKSQLPAAHMEIDIYMFTGSTHGKRAL
jgi:hypothetical protein